MNPSFFRLLPVILAIIAAGATSKTKPIPQQQSSKMMWGNLVVPEKEFTLPHLRQVFEEHIRKTPPSVNLLHINVSVEGREEIECTAKLRTDVSYEVWKSLYEDCKGRIPPSAEFLMLDGNSAMRMRKRDGHVVLIVLHGLNPFYVHSSAGDFYIVYLTSRVEQSAKSVPESKKSEPKNLTAYLTGLAPLDVKTGGNITKRLRSQIGVGELTVRISSNPWFIEDSDFPIVPTYVENAIPPAEVQFRREPQIYCLESESESNCSNL